jgi:hypothetical protein
MLYWSHTNQKRAIRKASKKRQEEQDCQKNTAKMYKTVRTGLQGNDNQERIV